MEEKFAWEWYARSKEDEIKLLEHEAEFYKSCNAVRQNGYELQQLKNYLIRELLELQKNKTLKTREYALYAQSKIRELQVTKEKLNVELEQVKAEFTVSLASKKDLSKELERIRDEMKTFTRTSGTKAKDTTIQHSQSISPGIENATLSEVTPQDNNTTVQMPKKKRGRPRKTPLPVVKTSETTTTQQDSLVAIDDPLAITEPINSQQQKSPETNSTTRKRKAVNSESEAPQNTKKAKITKKSKSGGTRSKRKQGSAEKKTMPIRQAKSNSPDVPTSVKETVQKKKPAPAKKSIIEELLSSRPDQAKSIVQEETVSEVPLVTDSQLQNSSEGTAQEHTEEVAKEHLPTEQISAIEIVVGSNETVVESTETVVESVEKDDTTVVHVEPTESVAELTVFTSPFVTDPLTAAPPSKTIAQESVQPSKPVRKRGRPKKKRRLSNLPTDSKLPPTSTEPTTTQEYTEIHVVAKEQSPLEPTLSTEALELNETIPPSTIIDSVSLSPSIHTTPSKENAPAVKHPMEINSDSIDVSSNNFVVDYKPDKQLHASLSASKQRATSRKRQLSATNAKTFSAKEPKRANAPTTKKNTQSKKHQLLETNPENSELTLDQPVKPPSVSPPPTNKNAHSEERPSLETNPESSDVSVQQRPPSTSIPPIFISSRTRSRLSVAQNTQDSEPPLSGLSPAHSDEAPPKKKRQKLNPKKKQKVTIPKRKKKKTLIADASIPSTCTDPAKEQEETVPPTSDKISPPPPKIVDSEVSTKQKKKKTPIPNAPISSAKEQEQTVPPPASDKISLSPTKTVEVSKKQKKKKKKTQISNAPIPSTDSTKEQEHTVPPPASDKISSSLSKTVDVSKPSEKRGRSRKHPPSNRTKSKSNSKQQNSSEPATVEKQTKEASSNSEEKITEPELAAMPKSKENTPTSEANIIEPGLTKRTHEESAPVDKERVIESEQTQSKASLANESKGSVESDRQIELPIVDSIQNIERRALLKPSVERSASPVIPLQNTTNSTIVFPHNVTKEKQAEHQEIHQLAEHQDVYQLAEHQDAHQQQAEHQNVHHQAAMPSNRTLEDEPTQKETAQPQVSTVTTSTKDVVAKDKFEPSLKVATETAKEVVEKDSSVENILPKIDHIEPSKIDHIEPSKIDHIEPSLPVTTDSRAQVSAKDVTVKNSIAEKSPTDNLKTEIPVPAPSKEPTTAPIKQSSPPLKTKSTDIKKAKSKQSKTGQQSKTTKKQKLFKEPKRKLKSLNARSKAIETATLQSLPKSSFGYSLLMNSSALTAFNRRKTIGSNQSKQSSASSFQLSIVDDQEQPSHRRTAIRVNTSGLTALKLKDTTKN